MFAATDDELCQLHNAQKNPHAQGDEHVEDLVDSVDNSIVRGDFRRFYTHLRHP